MKKSDIKKLEKVVDLYKKIEDILDDVHQNTLGLEEYMPEKNPMTVSNYLGHELIDVAHMRIWFESKLKIIKENNDYTEEKKE